MKRKYFFVILSLIFAIFLSGCAGGGVIPPSINLTGNWAITYTTTSGTPSFFDVGEVTNATCNIVDNNGSLTIYDFTIIGQEYINWNISIGIFSKPTFTTGHLSGSYINDYGSTVSLGIVFVGNINDDGTSGTGTWTATVWVNGVNGGNGSGTCIFIKD